MTLRESVEALGGEVKLAGVVDGAKAVDEWIPAGPELIRFAEAILQDSDEELAAARRALREHVGPNGVFDAAGVTGFFECVNRVADATGIPLEEEAIPWSLEVREEIGLNRFSTAVHTLGSVATRST